MTNQQVISKGSNQDPNGYPQPNRKQLWNAMMPIFVAALLGLTLSGCDLGDTLGDLFRINSDAQAQDSTTRTRIQTFVIVTDTFRIQVDADTDTTPSFSVQENTTTYTMQSTGFVRFDASDGTDSVEVEVNDQIVERPGADGNGTVTIIRVD